MVVQVMCGVVCGLLNLSVGCGWDKMLPFPAETLILWDDSIVAADFHDTLFIWTGESCKAQQYDGVREEFELLLLRNAPLLIEVARRYKGGSVNLRLRTR